MMRGGVLKALHEIEEADRLLAEGGRRDLAHGVVAAHMDPMPVLLESPFAGDVEANAHYAKLCMRDCLRRGEAPFAPHMLYAATDVLNDLKSEEREMGIQAGLAWGLFAARTVVYVDRGVSDGMRRGINAAVAAGRPIELRRLFPRKAGTPEVDLRTLLSAAPPQPESPARSSSV